MENRTSTSSFKSTPAPDIKRFPDVLCSACNHAIEGKIVSAMGKTWHPEHFTCHNCLKPILGEKFNQEKENPYCEECYATLFLKRCFRCQKTITDRIVLALDKTWHQEHFTCEECNKELTGVSFMERNGLPYCEECHRMRFSPKCNRCKKPIIDAAILALGEKWHQNCFLCYKCRKPVTDTTFEVVDNNPLCSACSNSIN